MRKFLALALCGAFLLATSPTAAPQKGPDPESAAQRAERSRAKQEPAAPLPSWWNSISVEEKQAILKAMANVLANVTKEQTLKDGLAKYPFMGVGVSYEADLKQKTEDARVYGMRVSSVFKDSPAARAGIQPGDWLVSVNGESICDPQNHSSTVMFPRKASDEEYGKSFDQLKACSDNFKKLVQGAHTSEIVLQIERDGTLFVYTVAKAEIGEKLALHNFLRYPAWAAALKKLRQPVSTLAKQIKKAGENDEKLAECWRTYELLRAKVEAPWREIAEIEASYKILPLPQKPD